MAFLVPRVFRDEVEVLATDDERAVHLGRDYGARQDPAADRDFACEGTLLIYFHTFESVRLDHGKKGKKKEGATRV